MKGSSILQPITAQPITAISFRPYGQLITPSDDGKSFDETDAQLDLKNGIPRFYIMRLQKRGRKFHQITRHRQCTQCLGSLGGKTWFIGVAPPSDAPEPELDKLMVFRITGDCLIKLALGTWHAGPYFDEETIDFYNLELIDTNSVDHFTYDFLQERSLEFEIVV